MPPLFFHPISFSIFIVTNYLFHLFYLIYYLIKTNGSVGKISQENIESLLKAAYDLRSQYVHLGSEFGDFIKPHKGLFNEVIIGEPRGLEEKVNKILTKSPTFLGIERILRYSMLRLIHKNGISIHKSLD